MARQVAVLGIALGVLLTPTLTHAGAKALTRARGVKMTVKEVKYHRGSYVVLLQTASGKRLLPIWIGDREAQAIQRRLSGSKTVRPMTHDLMEMVLSRLKGRLRSRYNVSVAEVDHQDLWQRSTLAVVCVAARKDSVEDILRTVGELVDRELPSEVLDAQTEFLS